MSLRKGEIRFCVYKKRRHGFLCLYEREIRVFVSIRKGEIRFCVYTKRETRVFVSLRKGDTGFCVCTKRRHKILCLYEKETRFFCVFTKRRHKILCLYECGYLSAHWLKNPGVQFFFLLFGNMLVIKDFEYVIFNCVCDISCWQVVAIEPKWIFNFFGH